MPGYSEGDLIKGAGHASAVGTVMARHSRQIMLVKVENASTECCTQKLFAQVQAVACGDAPEHACDRAKEMARHEALSAESDIRIFFADPRNRRQRGATRTPMACCGSTCRKERTCLR